MSTWEVVYTNEAAEDLRELDGSSRVRVLKAIEKVKQNPVPYTEGGYGKPLGNKGVADLTGLLKIKIKSPGIRFVYRLINKDGVMKIIIIAARSDDYVYREAGKRNKTSW